MHLNLAGDHVHIPEALDATKLAQASLSDIVMLAMAVADVEKCTVHSIQLRGTLPLSRFMLGTMENLSEKLNMEIRTFQDDMIILSFFFCLSCSALEDSIS